MTIESALLVYGPLGIMVGWFMFRMEKRLERIESALNGLTRGILIEVITRRDVPPAIEREARALLDELRPDARSA